MCFVFFHEASVRTMLLYCSAHRFRYTRVHTTRLRCGHVCLGGIDVVADPISEQLTIIIDD